jgi:hypothetical protein
MESASEYSECTRKCTNRKLSLAGKGASVISPSTEISSIAFTGKILLCI